MKQHYFVTSFHWKFSITVKTNIKYTNFILLDRQSGKTSLMCFFDLRISHFLSTKFMLSQILYIKFYQTQNVNL